MNEPITIEICAGSYEDCLAAENGGADRIELNSALTLGGLSPELSALIRAKNNISLPIICMCRPRPAGFHYSPSEIEGMFYQAKIMLDHGADGIAFGLLEGDGNIALENTKRFTELIHHYGKVAVFHRAFDVTPDSDHTIRNLIDCGLDRVLTSGRRSTVVDGVETIRNLQEKYGHLIEILPGSGITWDNAIGIIHETGVKQVHSSCKNYYDDHTSIRGDVNFSTCKSPNQLSYVGVDEKLVKKLVESVKGNHL